MLSILGVLLTVFSIAIAVNYGGQYYEEAREEAELGVAYNAIEQTQIAMSAYKATYLKQADNIDTLIAAGLMDETPRLKGMTFKPTWSSYKYSGRWTKGIVITDVPRAACELHNEKVGFIDAEGGKPADVFQATGCYTSGPDMTTGSIFSLLDRN